MKPRRKLKNTLYPEHLPFVTTRDLKRLLREPQPWEGILSPAFPAIRDPITTNHVVQELASRKPPKARMWVYVVGSATLLSLAVTLANSILAHPELFR
jgi:hypothetical protein